MARQDNFLTFAVLVGVGYLIYTHYQSPAATAKPAGSAPATGAAAQCKFPDGTMVAANADGTCPYDASHQGQSTPVTG